SLNPGGDDASAARTISEAGTARHPCLDAACSGHDSERPVTPAKGTRTWQPPPRATSGTSDPYHEPCAGPGETPQSDPVSLGTDLGLAHRGFWRSTKKEPAFRRALCVFDTLAGAS